MCQLRACWQAARRAGSRPTGRRVKKHLVRIALGLLVVLAFLGHAAGYYDIPLVDQPRGHRLRRPPAAHDAAARSIRASSIVDIDERSLARRGPMALAPRPPGLAAGPPVRRVRTSRSSASTWCSPSAIDSSGLTGLARAVHQASCGRCPASRRRSRRCEPKLEFDRIFADKMRGRAGRPGLLLQPRAGGQWPAGSGVLPAPGVAQGRLRRAQHRRHPLDRLWGQPAGAAGSGRRRRALQPLAGRRTG